jgi:hypothetical protein
MADRKSPLDGMRRVWHADPIDITAWSFFEDADPWRDLLAAGFAVYINKTLCEAFEEDPPHLWFAAMWGDQDGVGGKSPDDVTTLYLGLNLGAGEDSVCWSVSLEELINDTIKDGFINPDTPKKLAARLRELADKLDQEAPQ